MLLFHATRSTFTHFDNRESNYRERMYTEAEPGKVGTLVINPGGIYMTDNYWECSGFMGLSRGQDYARILMVRAKSDRIRIVTMEEYAWLRKRWFGEEYDSWRIFDRVAYRLQQVEGCDLVRYAGKDDYSPLYTEGEDGSQRYYDQYVCHDPTKLKIVGEYIHNQFAHSEVQLAA